MDPAGVSADGKDQRCYKEGQPADDKGPQNDPQGFCGFPFSGSRNLLAFQDTIGKLDFHVVKKERGAGGLSEHSEDPAEPVMRCAVVKRFP